MRASRDASPNEVKEHKDLRLILNIQTKSWETLHVTVLQEPVKQRLTGI